MLGNVFALLEFLPVFEAGVRSPGLRPEGQNAYAPYSSEDEAGSAFEKAAYAAGCVRPDVGWTEWVHTAEARALRDDPAVLAQASHDQLEHLLTAIIRSNRFSMGASVFDSGQCSLILDILRRAKVLAEEQPTDQ